MALNATNSALKKHAVGFKSINDFGPLIDSIKNKKIVMLGESSHGTKEFYEWRAKISRELIEQHGFSFIAVEGDWPACQKINRNISNIIHEPIRKTLSHFSRWPTWMWANEEMIPLLEWMKEFNEDAHHVGFHGLDVYSLYESMDSIKEIVGRYDPKLLFNLKNYYSCFDPYLHDEKSYVKSLFKFPEGCAEEVTEALESILKEQMKLDTDFFDAVQNARTIRNAEKYYRAMITGEDSWNIRDHHMMETLERLMEFYGSDAKGIVWAHNTHIGDYHATDMLLIDQINLGGLARKRYGDHEIALVGFSTFTGSVIASKGWDGKTEVMTVPEGMAGSLEAFLHEAKTFVGSDNYYFQFKDFKNETVFNDYLGHRAIGVVYHPQHERRGNYVPTIASRRYDAMIFIDETHALKPLSVKFDYDKIPETYPFGARI